MGNAIVLVILVIVIGSAVAYIIKAKRSGVRCIGCSAGGNGSCAAGSAAGCSGGCSGCGAANH